MSKYYSAPRKSSWNYGGNQWKLSRSKIDLFMQCPRCFYIDNRLGVKRPPGFPFNLHSAVDNMLKNEFDALRESGRSHPLIEQFGIDARPAPHEQIDEWRQNFKGVRYLHEPTGFTVTGAIDDLWINKDDEYIVVDYKATAKNEPIKELTDADYHQGYKRQLEVYQWLLRQNDLKVSDNAYWVYCTGDPNEERFDAQINFEIHIIPHNGNDDWVEPILGDIKECLDSQVIPDNNPDCDYCIYWNARNDEAETKV